MKNAIFVLSGNCRTFIDCIDSQCIHLFSKLFNSDVNIHLYLYLKLTDPGPKGQDGWNFKYQDININILLDKINKIKSNYPIFNIEYKLLTSDEISDVELLSQIKDRTLYIDFLSEDSKLLRGMHCHYNLEKCGNYILEKELTIQTKFDFIIYVRPDLYFSESCEIINNYDSSIITLGYMPGNLYNTDHIAIIPRIQFENFFFDRMNVYRNNISNRFVTQEEVYWHTISPYDDKPIGLYNIKRP